MLPVLILVIHIIYVADCTYDMDLKGKIKISQETLRNMYLRSDYDPNIVKLDLKIPSSLAEAFGLTRVNKTVLRISKPTEEAIMPDFIKKLTDEGVGRLTAAEAYLQDILDLKNKERNVLSMKLNDAITSYLSKLKDHITYLLKQNATSSFDKEILLLDIVTSSHDFYFDESLSLIEQIENSSKNKSEISAVKKKFQKETFEKNRETFKYLCTEMNLCRPYPAFSDFLTELTRVLLMLSDKRLKTITENLIKIMKNKQTQIETILEGNLMIDSGIELSNICNGHVAGIKDNLNYIHDIIAQRRKWQVNNNKKEYKRRRAIQIVLDMLDKVLDDNNLKLTSIQFSPVISAVHSWARGNNKDIEAILFSLISRIMEKLIQSWETDTSTKQEIQTLGEVILRGKPKLRKIYKYLFAEGSKIMKKD